MYISCVTTNDIAIGGGGEGLFICDSNVSVKSKLKHLPPPPTGAYVVCCPGGREFDELSLPQGGAFDHYS